MTATLFKIAAGTVYDPANGIDGEVRDLWIDGGKIVATPIDPAVRPTRTLDAVGLVVMPGGVDMHCHIAGAKVNTARRMLPVERVAPAVMRGELKADLSAHTLTSYETGSLYAGLGYTTALDAAIAPLAARHAHLEFADTPCLDKGCFILMGNNEYLLEAIRNRQHDRVRDFIAWLLGAAKGFAPKLVNPGGVAAWKNGRTGPVADIEERLDCGLSPREIIAAVARAAGELRLPHPLHLHCNNLGLAGNATTTLATMKALDGHRGHLAHIQFHSYGGDPNDPATFCSQVEPLVEYFNEHENLSLDVGQINFAPTISMTGDSAVGHYLSRVYSGPWYSDDLECESGCGIVPIEYKEKSLVHAWQWAIGLEWFLTARDPWRVALSTDHPNGGSFLAYPRIIRWLMNRDSRAETLAKIHPAVRRRSPLAGLGREYTLGEICIITRAAPARLLGLKNKGHLGPGADADVTIYTPSDDFQQMFEMPRHVIKAGELIVEDGEGRAMPAGKTLHVAADYDRAIEPHLAKWFDEHYSLKFSNYAVNDSYLQKHETVSCV